MTSATLIFPHKLFVNHPGIEKGLPSICIGPGSIAQAHTKDEFIAISDLEEGQAFFSKFIRSLAD